MQNINSKLILNIEIKDSDLLTELTTISMELSISLDQLILYSIEKMLYDINYVRKIRALSNSIS
jgi:hypothetical protein